MDISSVNSDLIRGNVTTIILGCLLSADKYGYEILKEIEDKSHSQYALKQATLYNQLKRLEKQGLVNSYDGAPDDTGGGKRRYYALTPEGRNYLLKERSEYEYSRTILDKLVSEKEFDFTKEIPFDASELRPYSKREAGEEKPQKVVYKEKVVEVENIVYLDVFGNRISEEEAKQAALQSMIDDEQARKNEKDLEAVREQLLTIEQERDAYAERLRTLEEEREQLIASGQKQNVDDERLRALEEECASLDEQLRATEEDRAAKEEKLLILEEERTAREEKLRALEEERTTCEAQLRDAEEDRIACEEHLRTLEEERASREEKLNSAEAELAEKNEMLRAAEEDRIACEERLRTLEEERTAREEKLNAAEVELAEKNEQLRAAKEEQLRSLEEERKSREAQLRTLEERAAREEQLHATELELVAKNEELRAAKEEHARLLEEERTICATQLRATEDDLIACEERLRVLEQERIAREEALRNVQAERDEAAEQLRIYREQQLAEEMRKRNARLQPSSNISELFAKLETESEYQATAGEQVVYEQTVYAQPTSEVHEEESTPYVEQPTYKQASMEDMLRLIDERQAQHEEELARAQAEAQAQAQMEAAVAADNAYCEAELQPNPSEIVANADGVTSAVIYNDQSFAYENASVNYRDFLYSINEHSEPAAAPVEQKKPQPQYSDDIKTRLYAKGFKVRPYDKGNTSEYYTYNFIHSNRINRDTFLIILALFVAEVAVMWISLASRISYLYFLPVLLVGSALCLIPTVMCLFNPHKRKRANFNFKLSILNRTMLFIELSVVCILIGFFALGASVNDIDIILSAIVLPAVLLLDLPISSVVYFLLYRTHKYHIS